jgi:hypothetical protein
VRLAIGDVPQGRKTAVASLRQGGGRQTKRSSKQEKAPSETLTKFGFFLFFFFCDCFI